MAGYEKVGLGCEASFGPPSNGLDLSYSSCLMYDRVHVRILESVDREIQ